MKKVVIVLIAVLVCFESFAQETLKGRWSTSGKAMGMTITQTLVFDAEQSGSVERILTLTFAMNVLGVKADGEMEMSTMLSAWERLKRCELRYSASLSLKKSDSCSRAGLNVST